MLYPDAFAVWLMSFLVVVTTRNFFAPFLPLAAIVLPLCAGTVVERAVPIILYGAIAGFAVASAVGSRVVIPVHAFSGKAPHWAGPLSVASASFIPYTLAVAVGWVAPYAEWDGSSAGTKAFYGILFSVLVLVLGSVLFTSWAGIRACPMAYRYVDSGVYAGAHPPSRYATESVLVLVLLAVPHIVWIATARDPVAWPQFIGGIIALGFKAGVWLAVWRLGTTRYAMDDTHFSPDRAAVAWKTFVSAVALVDLAATLAWLIVAVFATTGLAAELTLIFMTLGAFFVALGTWLLTPTFSRYPSQRMGAPAGPARRSNGSSSRGAPRLSEEERQRRLLDLQ